MKKRKFLFKELGSEMNALLLRKPFEVDFSLYCFWPFLKSAIICKKTCYLHQKGWGIVLTLVKKLSNRRKQVLKSSQNFRTSEKYTIKKFGKIYFGKFTPTNSLPKLDQFEKTIPDWDLSWNLNLSIKELNCVKLVAEGKVSNVKKCLYFFLFLAM